MFETAMIQNTAVVTASANGVAATRMLTRKTARESVDAPATTRTTGRCASRYAKIGDRSMPMNGPATMIATSVVEPPILRTMTGMKATRTDTKAPAPSALNRSIRKLRRTREGVQFGSVTARKLTAAPAPCHRPTRLGTSFGTRSIAARPRSVATAGPVAATTHAARRPGSEAAGAALGKGSAGAGRGRADDDAAVGLHAHRLGLQPGLTLHREVHDAALVGEHRLEGHGLATRPHARRDALRDLPQLVLAPPPVAFDVHRDVHRPANALRRDRAHDLLQRDQVLAAAADQRAEVGAEHVDALHARTILERYLGIDAHRLEQFPQNARAERELLGEGRRRLVALFLTRRAHGVGTARHLGLVDHRLRLRGALVFLERQHHARVLAAHAQHVRRLPLLEDLDVDLRAFAAERPEPALDRLLHRAPRELLPTQWAHFFPLLRPRRRPPFDRPDVVGSGSRSSDSSLSWSFMSCRASTIAACSRRWSSRSAGVGIPRRNGRYLGSRPHPLTKYCCTIWKTVVAIQYTVSPAGNCAPMTTVMSGNVYAIDCVMRAAGSSLCTCFSGIAMTDAMSCTRPASTGRMKSGSGCWRPRVIHGIQFAVVSSAPSGGMGLEMNG